jgi:hypothetical protein
MGSPQVRPSDHSTFDPLEVVPYDIAYFTLIAFMTLPVHTWFSHCHNMTSPTSPELTLAGKERENTDRESMSIHTKLLTPHEARELSL